MSNDEKKTKLTAWISEQVEWAARARLKQIVVGYYACLCIAAMLATAGVMHALQQPGLVIPAAFLNLPIFVGLFPVIIGWTGISRDREQLQTDLLQQLNERYPLPNGDWRDPEYSASFSQAFSTVQGNVETIRRELLRIDRLEWFASLASLLLLSGALWCMAIVAALPTGVLLLGVALFLVVASLTWLILKLDEKKAPEEAAKEDAAKKADEEVARKAEEEPGRKAEDAAVI